MVDTGTFQALLPLPRPENEQDQRGDSGEGPPLDEPRHLGDGHFAGCHGKRNLLPQKPSLVRPQGLHDIVIFFDKLDCVTSRRLSKSSIVGI